MLRGAIIQITYSVGKKFFVLKLGCKNPNNFQNLKFLYVFATIQWSSRVLQFSYGSPNLSTRVVPKTRTLWLVSLA